MSDKTKEMTDDELVEQVKAILKNGSNTLIAIIAETLARDRGISEDEFKTRIGMGNSDLDEQGCIRQGIFNIMVEKLKLQVKINNTLKNEVALLQGIVDRKEKKHE